MVRLLGLLQCLNILTPMAASSLLAEVRALPLRNERAIGAVVGACVADAAARPMHWLYDAEKLESYLVSGQKDPAFFPTSVSPFYSLPTGANSCYFDLGFVMLQSLDGSSLTAPNLEDRFKANLLQMFGDGTEYNQAYRRRTEKYDPKKRYDSREPIEGPWQQSSVSVFLEGGGGGNPQSKETDGLVSTLPLIAQMASAEGSGLDQDAVRKLASILSSNAFALSHTLSAASILASVIDTGEVSGSAFVKAVERVDDKVLALAAQGPGQEGVLFGKSVVLSELRHVLAAAEATPDGSDHVARVLHWGKPCANPGSFQGALHAVLTSKSFAQGTRQVVRAGGCNCSRANLAGSLLGACFLFDEDKGGIPASWLQQSDKAEATLRLALEKFRP